MLHVEIPEGTVLSHTLPQLRSLPKNEARQYVRIFTIYGAGGREVEIALHVDMDPRQRSAIQATRKWIVRQNGLGSLNRMDFSISPAAEGSKATAVAFEIRISNGQSVLGVRALEETPRKSPKRGRWETRDTRFSAAHRGFR